MSPLEGQRRRGGAGLPERAQAAALTTQRRARRPATTARRTAVRPPAGRRSRTPAAPATDTRPSRTVAVALIRGTHRACRRRPWPTRCGPGWPAWSPRRRAGRAATRASTSSVTRLGQRAVDREQRDVARLGVAGGHGVDQRGVAVLRRLVRRRLDGDLQHVAAGVPGRLGERVEGRLLPGPAARLGHDRRDHVDQLRERRGVHAVGVPQQRDQQVADDDGVGDVVAVLQQHGRDGPVVARSAAWTRRGAGTRRSTRRTRCGSAWSSFLCARTASAVALDGLDEVVHVDGGGQERAEVAVLLPVVGVRGDEVDLLVGLGEHDPLPLAERRAWRRRRSRRRRARGPGRPCASRGRSRRRAGRTRRRSCGRSATGRPSRCPGTTCGCRTGPRRRWRGAGRTGACRRGRCSTRAGRAASCTPRVPRLTAIIGSTLGQPAPSA